MSTIICELYHGLLARLADLSEDTVDLGENHISGLFVTAFHGVHRLTVLKEKLIIESVSVDIDWIVRGLARRRGSASVIKRAKFNFSIPKADPENFDYDVEAIKLETGVFEQLSQDVELLPIPSGPHKDENGRDGISLLGEILNNGQSKLFSAWSPSKIHSPAVWTFFTSILSTGENANVSDKGRELILNCLSYLQ